MTGWNPHAPSVVGMEWMPTIEDTVPVTSTERALVVRMGADAANEVITTLWLYIGKTIAPGTAIAVEVYEDGLPMNQTQNTGLVRPAWDNPSVGMSGHVKSSSGIWAGYSPGVLNAIASNVAGNSDPATSWSGRLKDDTDTTGIYNKADISWFMNPGAYAYFKGNGNGGAGSPWPGRRIIALGTELRVRNLKIEGSNGTYIHVFPILNKLQGEDSYEHVVRKGIIMEPNPRSTFQLIKSPKLFTCPATNAPWTLKGVDGAMQFLCDQVDGVAANDRFGVRIAAPLATPLQVSISDMALRAWWVNEDRVAYGHFQVPSLAASGGSGLSTDGAPSSIVDGQVGEDGWLGITLRKPGQDPANVGAWGFSKRATHEYFFVIHVTPDVSANNGADLAMYGSTEIGSFSVSRLGENRPDRSGPKALDTRELVLANSAGIIKSVKQTSTRIFSTVLERELGGYSTDGFPYNDYQAIPLTSDISTSAEQEITPDSTIANIQAVRTVIWAPESVPDQPCVVTITHGGSTIATGLIWLTELGDGSSAPGEHVVLLDAPITLTGGQLYLVQFTSASTGWMVGAVAHRSMSGDAGSYGGAASSAIWMTKDFEGDIPISLHQVPAAPTGFAAQRVSVRV